MSYLLRIDSSANGDGSFSRRVADTFEQSWSGEVVRRDLARQPVGHLGIAGITARVTPAAEQTAEQRAAAAVQDELVEEFLGAGAYLFTVPMYNYAMPSVFKAWLDHVMVVGTTIGLGPGAAPSAGRPAVVVSARGGGYGPDAPQHGKDFVVPALHAILGDPVLMDLDIRVITPELTYAPVMEALRPLLGQHQVSMAESHSLAQRYAQELTASASA